MNAVENVFCLYARGNVMQPVITGMRCDNGAFHIKAGLLGLNHNYFVTKINANFPGNPKKYQLPTIQGVIVVCNAVDGRLLALMDSMEITILRTGAATGVAAKYLASETANIATICGCGNQGRISVRALQRSRRLRKLFAFDVDHDQIDRFRLALDGDLEIVPVGMADLGTALRESHIVVTCTPSKQPFIWRAHQARTFIAAVGADSEDKQELHPDLLARNTVVTDLTDQCISIGELHHAIANGMMTRTEVHAELGEVIAGKKPGRTSGEEIIIFDSTGTALQDVAAAAIVYEKAIALHKGNKIDFSSQASTHGATIAKTNEGHIKALRRWFPFK